MQLSFALGTLHKELGAVKSGNFSDYLGAESRTGNVLGKNVATLSFSTCLKEHQQIRKTLNADNQ